MRKRLTTLRPIPQDAPTSRRRLARPRPCRLGRGHIGREGLSRPRF